MAATTNGTVPIISTSSTLTTSSIISSTSTQITTSTPSTSSAASSTSTPLSTTSTTPSVVFTTSIFTAPPTTATLPNGGVTTVFATSTNIVTRTQAQSQTSSTATNSAQTSGAAGLNTPSQQDSSSPSATTIAVATVVPIVVVILLVLGGIWFWRRRKGRQNAEEMRRKEMEEYGFNPNNDPTLAPVTSTVGDEPSTMRERDAGYRGWGTTTNTQKASTTMSSNPGVARSDSGGHGGYNGQPSPSAGGYTHTSDGQSGDPLVAAGVANGDEVGALGGAPSASSNRGGVHRGPSNASSAYSGANYSDVSGDGPLPGGSPQEYGGYMHPDEAIGTATYGDGGWAAQPVIKDVSARRNTRIENPTVVPHQGGIAQNF